MTDPDRATFIQALRDLAYFLEQRPAIKTPYYAVLNVILDTRDELAAHARAASWEKEWLDDWLVLRRTFSEHLKLEVNLRREKICHRVVTGTRIVPARPEREVEVVEWVCDEPVLLAAGERS